jgi:hypothetical protein
MPTPSPAHSPPPRRILDAVWRDHLDLLPRGDESGPVYAARIRRVDLRGLPEPVVQAVRALVGLVSASAMADVTGIAFEEFVGPVERN